MRLRHYLFLIFAMFCALECSAQRFQVKVVKISDGDTFTAINRDNLQIKFRIHGIDAPEKKQAFGNRAKEHLGTLIFGKWITVDVQKQDRWGRYVAHAYTAENKDVALEMIKAGMAWQFIEYDTSEQYREAEQAARKKRVGLWSDPHCISPWDFRKNK